MTIDLEVQDASGSDAVPGEEDFLKWITPVLKDKGNPALAVRIVDEAEMQSLNARYRGKDKPTNVLSFPTDIPAEVKAALGHAPLGDIVLCAPVVKREAAEQGKPETHHWAHLCVHGVLHLLGHDHQDDEEAEAMESLEREYLAALGIPDPYRE